MKRMLGVAVLLCAISVSGVHAKDITERAVPVPQTVSTELQALIGNEPLPWWNTHPRTAQEWKKWVGELAKEAAATLPALREKMGATVADGTMN